MAFEVINASEIDVGDALKKELFDKVKNSLDNLDTRTTSLEAGAAKVDVFRYIVTNATSANSMTGLDYYVATESFTITNATIQIFEKGSLTGELEIDIKKSTTDLDTASFSTIFTIKPKLTWASIANYAISTNQTFDSGNISVVSGDILRFDVTEFPLSGTLGKFIINVYGEK